MGRVAVALLVLALAAPGWGAGPIRVVTTLPDLADWVREIGGDRAEATSLLRGFENPHTYEPKVSDIRSLAGARMLVTVGLGLEEWIGGLVENAGNADLRTVVASRGVEVIGTHGAGEHHDGDHPAGNPHVWLDPAAAATMCRNIARGLEAIDPAGREGYERRLDAYLSRLDALARQLRERVAQLPDRRFVSYHPAWPYFARGLGFEEAGVVTEIPGQEPSARDLVNLIERIRAEKIRVLVTEPQLSSKLPDLLAQETGIRVVTLSPLLGTGPAKTYLGLLEHDAETLIAALRESSR